MEAKYDGQSLQGAKISRLLYTLCLKGNKSRQVLKLYLPARQHPDILLNSPKKHYFSQIPTKNKKNFVMFYQTRGPLGPALRLQCDICFGYELTDLL